MDVGSEHNNMMLSQTKTIVTKIPLSWSLKAT
jgi:hypothetical protein